MNHRAHPLAAVLVGLLLVVTTTALVEPAAAKPRKGGSSKAAVADRPWSGFKLRATKKADGGFLGGRILADGQVVYRIDPGRKAASRGFLPGGTLTEAVAGTGSTSNSTTNTSRAAWIVGKYGAYRDKVQSAAVELALHELLVGGKWALKGSATRARLRQLPAGKRAAVVRFTRTMLEGARKFASTYDVTMTTTPSVVRGGASTSTVRVTTAGGVGVPNLLVSYASPGGTSTARTDGEGRATATLPAVREGANTTTATIANVPENRLLVLTPLQQSSSRVVVADKKTDRVLSATTTGVVARPTASLISNPRKIGQDTGQAVDIAGGIATARTARATLHGPFASAAAVSCGTGAVLSGTFPVSGNGRYALPGAAPGAQGWYVWNLVVDGNTENDATRACGGTMVVKSDPTARVRPESSTSVMRGQEFSAVVDGTGFPARYRGDGSVVVRLYGPYGTRNDGPPQPGGPTPDCSGAPRDSIDLPAFADDGGRLYSENPGQRRFQAFANAGQYYLLVAVVPADREGRGDAFQTACGAAGSRIDVR